MIASRFLESWANQRKLRANCRVNQCWYKSRYMKCGGVCRLISNDSSAVGWCKGMRTAESNYQTQMTLPINCSFSFWCGFGGELPSLVLKMFRRCSGVITSSSRAQTGFSGHRVRICVFLPSLIADNEGRVNHLLFTAGMSLTEAWWLMSGLLLSYLVLQNHRALCGCNVPIGQIVF